MKRVATAISLAVLLSVPAYAQHRRDDQRPDDRRSVQSEQMTGTVVGVNQRLNYVTIRSDQSNRHVKIDVRHMDARRSGVWRLRRGDRISVTGAWENRDTFDARNVERSRQSRH